MKFTKDGIQDYLNAAGKSFTIGRFDAKVGDKYTYESANGGTLTRTVTARSEEDEYPYGFYYIKTITIEEQGRDPAIKKIEYRLNHRFGLVSVWFTLQDGTSYGANLYSIAENN